MFLFKVEYLCGAVYPFLFSTSLPQPAIFELCLLSLMHWLFCHFLFDLLNFLFLCVNLCQPVCMMCVSMCVIMSAMSLMNIVGVTEETVVNH